MPKDTGFRPIIGIDLGTTNSAVAYIQKGQPHIIPNAIGEHITPSVVLLDLNNKVVVGGDALAALVAMPERTKAAVKRDVGGKEPIMLAGTSYMPEEISAMILKELKKSVDRQLGEGEKEAVITVPAYFNDEQRRATKRSGELAGFVVERIINEPTAAALAFGFQHMEQDRHLLVYDLGGGTFDVSVVELIDGILEVKASAGNSHLGGEDFDWLVVDWLAEQMIKEYQVDPRKDLRGKAVLKEEAERVKKQLSFDNVVTISLPIVTVKEDQPIGLYTQMTREGFIELIHPLLLQTMDKVQTVLKDAELEVRDIDDILLVGGSTRIPYVRQLIRDTFKKNPREDVNPDEAVAFGAAVQAGLKSGALSTSGLIVTDVAPFSMGIAVVKETLSQNLRPGAFRAIIPRNTTIPVTRTEVFNTVSDFQTGVMIEVYQGESEWVKNNYLLNEFLLEGLDPAPAGQEKIHVTFRYNLNGILEVTAKGSSKEITISIQDSLDRSTEEAFEDSVKRIEALQNEQVQELDEFEGQLDGEIEVMESDRSLKQLQDEAMDLLKRCRRMFEDKLDDSRLVEVITTLQQVLQTGDADELQEVIDDATDVLIDLDM